jgi:(p)ppGpp synthase/HD superfamily hydrolase
MEPEKDIDVVELAQSIARKAHEGQFRRDGVTPYITHPEAVARSLEGEEPNVVATAWLHDVLEDTQTSYVQLRNAGIPWEVIDAVVALTKTEGQSYDDYLDTVVTNPIAKKVKIADIHHNLSDSPTLRQLIKYYTALELLDS